MAMPRADIAPRYGRLQVVRSYDDPTRKSKNKTRLECICDCGKTCDVAASHARSGHTRSCGCLAAEVKAVAGKTHGLSHTPAQRSWYRLRALVRDGVRIGANKVCHEYDPRWDDFTEFYADFGDLTEWQKIKRIDSSLPWRKDNCYIEPTT